MSPDDRPRPALDAEPLEFSDIPDDYIRVWDHILNAYSHEDFKTLMYLDYVMRGRLKTYARSKAERVRLGKLRNASKPPYDQEQLTHPDKCLFGTCDLDALALGFCEWHQPGEMP